MKIEAKKDLRRLITVVLASLLMAINIKTFVRTGGLYPGGATGLTILIQRISQMYLPHEIPYSPINILLNAIPVYIGFRFIGISFLPMVMSPTFPVFFQAVGASVKSSLLTII